MTTFDTDFLGERPARPSLIGRFPIDRALAMVRQHISSRRRAQAVAHLPDHLLRDIGLDPKEVRGSYPAGATLWLPAGFRGGQ